MRRHLGLALLSGLALSGCKTKPSQLVVLVDSDYTPSVEIETVTYVVYDLRRVRQEAGSLDVERYGLPLSFAVVAGDLPDERVEITVEAHAKSGELLSGRRAIVGFVAGESRLLNMFLARGCLAVLCGEGETCTERGCQDEQIAAADLPVAAPGKEIQGARRDAGPGAADAGGGDSAAAIDGASTDLGTEADAQADAGSAPDVSPRDSGPGNPDASRPVDGGPGNPDAIVRMDAGGSGLCGGQCASAQACVHLGERRFCRNGDPSGSCSCLDGCDPMAVTSGCTGQGDACFLPDVASPRMGVCVPGAIAGTGGQNDRCTVILDMQGVAIDDDCNHLRNLYCVGDAIDGTGGRCARLCSLTAMDQLCSTLGNYSCQPTDTAGLGLCMHPPRSATDIGLPCVGPETCMTRVCLDTGAFFGACSAECGGLDACPSGSVCVPGAPDSYCLPRCLGAQGQPDDAICRAIDASSVCQDAESPYCVPGCQLSGCDMNQTCDLASGHCR